MRPGDHAPFLETHENSVRIGRSACEERSRAYCIVRRAMEMKVQGRRKTGIPKIRWLDKVKDDIKEKGLSVDEVYDRATWRRISTYIDPKKNWE